MIKLIKFILEKIEKIKNPHLYAISVILLTIFIVAMLIFINVLLILINPLLIVFIPLFLILLTIYCILVSFKRNKSIDDKYLYKRGKWYVDKFTKELIHLDDIKKSLKQEKTY